MKTKVLFLIGIITILLSLYFVSLKYENGDKNAASMYVLVYSIPLMIISLINCGLLKFAEKNNTNKIISTTLVILFPLISILLILIDDISLNLFGTIGIISFGITNLIWYLTFKKKINEELRKNITIITIGVFIFDYSRNP